MCAGSLSSDGSASTASMQDKLSSAILEAVHSFFETHYPVPCVLSSLSDLQKQLVCAAERLRNGPHCITFEVRPPPALRVHETVCVRNLCNVKLHADDPEGVQEG